jgi:FlaA1/EpsC-like NDP-sugar epimerase
MRNRYVLLFDVIAFALAVCGAFALRFDLYFFRSRPEFVPYVLVAPAIKALIFYGFGIYRRFWRYASVNDLVALALADSTASVAMAAFVSVGIFRGFIYEFSRSVLIVDWILCLALTAAIRLCIRVVAESQKRSGDGGRSRRRDTEKRVLIVGAGDAGMLVAREMQRNAHLGMVPVGFVDDDPVKLGKRIYGLPVIGRTSDLQKVIASVAADEVVIAMPKAPGSILRRVADECRDAAVRSRTIPGVFELLDGHVSVSRLRQVEITDLLRRRSIDVAPDSNGYVLGRDVLVTGAGGSIGFELSRQVAYGRPRRLTLLGHGENSIFEAQRRLNESFPNVHIEAVIADVRDRARVQRVFDRVRPEIVFHAAAHKHVPLMECNPEEAISNNVTGTKNIVDAAARFEAARLVLISSDKAVSPSSLMGASKRVAEAIVRAAAVQHGRAFATVRFGNVLGSRGSVVPAFKRQIEAGGPITVTHPDMKRFFMTIPEAVHLVLQAGGMARGGELFVLNMGEPLRIVELAEDLIRLSGLSTDDIAITFTGLRPGEKLEECLWENGAAIKETDNPDIFCVVEPHGIDPQRLDSLLEPLVTAASRADRIAMDVVLTELIPTFRPLSAFGSDGAPVLRPA